MPFLQVATQSASDILLKGLVGIRRPDDQYVAMTINTKLSDITIGAAPNLTVLPVPPPEPVVVTPPVVPPPVQPPHTPDPAPVIQPAPIPAPPATAEPPVIVRLPIYLVLPGEMTPLDPTDPALAIDPIAAPDLPSIRVVIGDPNPILIPYHSFPYDLNIDFANGVAG